MRNEHLRPYEEALREHGGGFEATLWGSPKTQALRFEVCASLLGDALCSGVSVLDLGCGDGAFARWLIRDHGIQATMHGVDAMQQMVDVATSHNTPGATFDVCNLTLAEWPDIQPASIVVLSGTLNTMPWTTVQGVLERAWSHTKVAFAFNFLGDNPSPKWRNKPLGPARRHAIAAIRDWATARSARVDMRSDYLDGHDVTMCMWRSL